MPGSDTKKTTRYFRTSTLILVIFFWALLALRSIPNTENQPSADANWLFWFLKYALFPFVFAWFVFARKEKHPLS